MEREHYTAESLRGELDQFEVRYGVASARLFAMYRADEVPAQIPRFDAFVWADAYEECCRLSGGVGRAT